MADVKAMVRDPEFQALPWAERHNLLTMKDPEYAALSPSDQAGVMNALKTKDYWKPATAATDRSTELGKGAKLTAEEVGQYDANRAAFEADNGEPIATVKRVARKAVKAAAPYARPILEGGGATLGAILGAGGGGAAGLAGGPAAPGTVPYGAIAGGVAGGTLGFAAGKDIADKMEGVEQSPIQTLKDLRTGATYAMGGEVIGALGAKTLNAGLNALRKVKPAVAKNAPAFTDAAIRRKAGEVLKENTGEGAVYEKNAEDAAKVAIPGYKPSLGEARNDPGLIKLQRGIERQPGTAGNIIMEQKAANQSAVKDYLQNEFTGNESIDDVITALNQKKAQIEATTGTAQSGADAAKSALNPADPQAVGRNISDEIGAALAPVKTAEREAWAKVPNYPIPSNHFNEAADALRNTPLEADTQAAVGKILDYADKVKKNTEGMQSIERTINDKMYAPNADPNVKRVLGQLKKAIGEDFKAMGEAADTGDIALHNGQVVHPSKIQTEIDTLKARIANDSKAAGPAVDTQAVQTALKNAGDPPNQWMKQTNETQAQFTNRITARFHHQVGGDLPIVSGGESANTSMWKDRLKQLEDMAANLKPAEDVAAAYRAAKDVSKERFDRFGKGAVSDITQSGNQATGLKLPDSAIPKKIFDREGADSFITAVGKNKAAAHADQFAAHELLNMTNPMTGELSTKTVTAWLQKNMQVLRKYGISGKYNTIAKAQAAVDAARATESEFSKSTASKILGSDVEKAVASAFSSNPSNTGAVVDSLMSQIGKDKQGQKGLQNAFKDFIVSKVETTAKTISGDSIISPAAIQKELVKYAPAMRRLYANDPGKIAALQKVSKAVEIQSRSAKSPIGGGSDTAENLNSARAILGKVVDIIPGGGLVRGLVRAGLGKLQELNAAELNKVIARALYDPELAQTLVLASKQYKPEVVAKRIDSHLVTMGLIATRKKENNQQKENPNGR